MAWPGRERVRRLLVHCWAGRDLAQAQVLMGRCGARREAGCRPHPVYRSEGLCFLIVCMLRSRLGVRAVLV
jgi:hypothetical protein